MADCQNAAANKKPSDHLTKITSLAEAIDKMKGKIMPYIRTNTKLNKY